MGDPQMIPAPADASPDWSTLPDHVPCPLCEYNLRGLVDPRCPECGYAFTWPALFEARRNTHPYIFEHHPRRNVWSFWRTFAAGFRPVAFWTRLSPAHDIRPRRLAIYWAAVSVLLLIFAVAIFGRSLYSAAATLRTNRSAGIAAYSFPANARYAQDQAAIRGITVSQWLDWVYPPPGTPRWFQQLFRRTGPDLFPFIAMILAWPYATTLTLLIFRQSMRKARVRPAQVLRCTIYSGDAAPLIFLVIAPLSLTLLPYVYLAYAGYRLAVAYRSYLRFDHAAATVFTSQVIVWLAAWKFALVWDGY